MEDFFSYRIVDTCCPLAVLREQLVSCSETISFPVRFACSDPGFGLSFFSSAVLIFAYLGRSIGK